MKVHDVLSDSHNHEEHEVITKGIEIWIVHSQQQNSPTRVNLE